MDAGPVSFRGAPVSKGIVLASAASSLLWLSGVLKPYRRAPRQLGLLIFPHVGSLIFGLALLYQSRHLERQAGSSKHAALVALSLGLQLLLLLAGSPAGTQLPHTGPLPLIFASLTLFTLETPAVQRFSLLGVQLTEKVFVQAAGAQLAFSSPRGSLAAMLAGVALGVAYHCNALGMRTWKVPAALAEPVARLLGPLLQDGGGAERAVVQPQQPAARQGGAGVVPAPAAAAAAGAALGGGAAAGQRGGAARAASREGVEQLVAMGFSESVARSALEQTDNDLAAAANLLL